MRWLLVLLCLILLAPLGIVDVPPLLDYPNHLARAVVLASDGADPVLARMYAARWGIIPNLATDLLLPPLLQVLPVHVAGRIVVALVMLLPVIGIVAYSRVVFRVSAAWPLASALVAYNATFLLGFLNFIIGIGVALLLAAAWIAWRERHPRLVVLLAAAGTVVLFFCHLMGLLFFYLLIAGYEVEQLWLHRTRLRLAMVRLAAVVPLILPPLGLYLLSPLAPVIEKTVYVSIADKFRQLAFPFANYILPLDIATACAVAAFLLACVATRRCRVTLGSGVTLVLTAVLFFAAPFAFKGTYLLDTRFVIMLGFLLFGAMLPTGLPKPAARTAFAAFSLLFAVRMAVVVVAWQGHRQDLVELRAAIAPVEPGARVLVVSVIPEDAPAYWQTAPLSRQLSFGDQLDHHMPALLLIERRAYWPFLFDNPSQQPVVTLPPYQRLAALAESYVGHHALRDPGNVEVCGYDYLLLLDAGGEPDVANFAADRLRLLTHTDIAALYRIRPEACPSLKLVVCAGADCRPARPDQP